MEIEEKKNLKNSGNFPEWPVACSWMDDAGKISSIVVNPLNGKLVCERCKSYSCFHVKYAMTFPRTLEKRDEAMRHVCSDCYTYNLDGALYCSHCGKRMGE